MIEEETISVEFQNVDDEYVQIFAFDSRDYFINWFKKRLYNIYGGGKRNKKIA